MMVHGQNGAHLLEFLLRDKQESYTQGKQCGLTPVYSRDASLRQVTQYTPAFFQLDGFAVSAPAQVKQTVGR
jgi:hypothetical protein